MSKFKVGNAVYGITEGLGTITNTHKQGNYPIRVEFGENGEKVQFFTAEGKNNVGDLNPTLLTLEEAQAKGYDVPKQKVKMRRTFWLNIYQGAEYLHRTKEEADIAARHLPRRRTIYCKI